MGRKYSMSNSMRDIASDIEALEDDYDNLVAELEEDKNEIDRLKDSINEMQKYIEWAQTFYPEMEGQYKALCDVRG